MKQQGQAVVTRCDYSIIGRDGYSKDMAPPLPTSTPTMTPTITPTMTPTNTPTINSNLGASPPMNFKIIQ